MHNSAFRFSPRRASSPLTHPVLVAAMLGALLSGCSASVPSNDTDPGMAQSSEAQEATSEGVMDNDGPTDTEDRDEDDRDEDDMMPPASSSAATKPAEAAATDSMKTYADGTYTADGAYRSPAGEETVSVTLTLENGVVKAASSDTASKSEKSTKFKGLFAAGLSQAVVGKSIDSLSLDVVNGSSLTPKGFMDALAKIKSQAAA